jgi:hypothetical protein
MSKQPFGLRHIDKPAPKRPAPEPRRLILVTFWGTWLGVTVTLYCILGALCPGCHLLGD